MILHFDGTDPDDEVVSMFTLDPSKTPKQIDFVGVSSTISGDKTKGEKSFGVYKLDGDTLVLTICWGERDRKNRPTDLKPNAEKKISSYKLIRSKTPISENSTRVNERP